MRDPRVTRLLTSALLILGSCTHPHELENRLQGTWLLTEIRTMPVEERNAVIYTFTGRKLIADGLPGPRSCSRSLRVNEDAQTLSLAGEDCPWATDGFPTATDYAVLPVSAGDQTHILLYDRTPGDPSRHFELVRINASQKDALLTRYRIGG